MRPPLALDRRPRSVDGAAAQELINYPLAATDYLRRRLPVIRPPMQPITPRVVGVETRQAVVEVATSYRPSFGHTIDRANTGLHASIQHADGRPVGHMLPMEQSRRGLERRSAITFNDRLPVR